MYTVGEFAHLAQVSKRLLRYYDEIGLFKPNQIDRWTGYRYYSAEQMPQLNRILALKELGLTLTQIQRTLEDDVSADELQGMLTLRKAEIEQQLDAELRRIREIEARLRSIRNAEEDVPPNVVIKQVSESPVLSVRGVFDDFEASLEFYTRMQRSLPRRFSGGMLFCICRNDIDIFNQLDLEFGVFLDQPEAKPLPLAQDIVLVPGELPPHPMMATTVVTGALETIHTGYADIIRWSAIKRYRLTGIHRELCLQMATTPDGSNLITEIQVPIEPLSVTESLT